MSCPLPWPLSIWVLCRTCLPAASFMLFSPSPFRHPQRRNCRPPSRFCLGIPKRWRTCSDLPLVVPLASCLSSIRSRASRPCFWLPSLLRGRCWPCSWVCSGSVTRYPLDSGWELDLSLGALALKLPYKGKRRKLKSKRRLRLKKNNDLLPFSVLVYSVSRRPLRPIFCHLSIYIYLFKYTSLRYPIPFCLSFIIFHHLNTPTACNKLSTTLRDNPKFTNSKQPWRPRANSTNPR